MQLHKSAVIDTPTRRLVEMTFADQSNLDEAVEFLTFRFPVAQGEYLRLPELQLEAIRHAQTVMGDEIRRLEQICGRDN